MCRVELDESRFTADALAGLGEVVFDRVAEAAVENAACHPRGRTDWPRARIFAQRRRAGRTGWGRRFCRLRSVSGLAIEVEALDAIDGTPVVDVKPSCGAGFRRQGRGATACVGERIDDGVLEREGRSLTLPAGV